MNGVRRIFYDKTTGERIHEIGRSGDFTLPTIEQDIATFSALSERVRETFDFIELPFGEYAQDFAECNGYRVNVETKEIEFSYPNPSAPEEAPVFQKPLSEQLEELKQRDATMQDDINFIFETLGG